MPEPQFTSPYAADLQGVVSEIATKYKEGLGLEDRFSDGNRQPNKRYGLFLPSNTVPLTGRNLGVFNGFQELEITFDCLYVVTIQDSPNIPGEIVYHQEQMRGVIYWINDVIQDGRKVGQLRLTTDIDTRISQQLSQLPDGTRYWEATFIAQAKISKFIFRNEIGKPEKYVWPEIGHVGSLG